ncbi:peptidase MA family metallohydrolase [Desulfuribacillus alkaliarsenatis]|uniref:Peptidase MA-like domain-containing protein n=1 Tax=Desulfuribacillus alkaliarsenatis TaxID=766136 RepID=A0A1E5G2S6_9FIRM|nr:peptidase MA family metallohydrolase [Desulfuribacillus alkaliarsenatis]OEF97341.1 hypothetical protein BHF68_03780 [Desulfuribacillus alkaliarsenatis]
MRIMKVILVVATPLLLFISLIALYFNNQVNLTTYAQPVIRSAIDVANMNSLSDWSVIENELVVIRYHSVDEEEIEMVLEIATDIRKSLDDRYQFHYNKPVNIVIKPTREEMREFFGWGESASAVGVYYGKRIYLLAPSLWVDADSIEQLTDKYLKIGPIAHEYTHFIIDHKYHNNVPRWYNEAVAQYEEYLYQGFEWIEPYGRLNQQLYSYQEMQRDFDNLPNQALSYRQGFMFLKYQIDKYGEEKYWDFMGKIENRFLFEQAFAQVYGIDISDVWQEWEQHVVANKLR